MSPEYLKIYLPIFKEYGVFGIAIITVLLFIVIPFCKRHFSLRFGRMINFHMIVDEQINNFLNKICFDLNGQRAYVLQYHNGIVNSVKCHFVKLSCSHERSPVVVPVISKMDNIQNSQFAYFNSLLMKNKTICYCDIQELSKKDPGLFAFFNEHGATGVYVCGFWDSQNIPVGMVILELKDNGFNKNRKLTNEEINIFNAASLKICGLILSIKSKGFLRK